MNERISEIWDQAATESAFLRSGENSWETQKQFIEKFAQLIVRECADIADTAQAEKMGWDTFGWIIKEHFGVE